MALVKQHSCSDMQMKICNKQMQAHKQIHASQVCQQGLNDVTLKCIEDFNVSCSL